MVPTLVTRDGQIYLNDLKRYAKGCLSVPATANNPITVVASTRSAPLTIEGSQDAATEILSMQAVHAASDAAAVQNRLEVMITENATRRQLMNRPILVSQAFGIGQRPFRLNESLLLEGQQTISVEFINNSAAGDAHLYWGLEARKFQGFGLGHELVRDWLNIKRKRAAYLAPFWLTSDNTLSITAGATGRSFFTNTSDRYLMLNYIMAKVITTGSAGNEAAEFFEFLIYDAKTKRQLSNQPVTMNTGCGTAQYPFRLEDPLIVEPATQLMVEFTNLVTNATIEIFFTFAGVQCFDTGAPFSTAQLNQPKNAGVPTGGMQGMRW